MQGYNRVFLLGNIGRIETLTTNNGSTLVKVSLATNRHAKNSATGEKTTETEWHNLIFSNIGNYKLAEIAATYLKKGQPIFIDGEIRTRKWETKQGEKRQTVEIYVKEMMMLPSQTAPAPAPVEMYTPPPAQRPQYAAAISSQIYDDAKKENTSPNAQLPNGLNYTPGKADNFIDDDIPF